jgi:hypothetical protein
MGASSAIATVCREMSVLPSGLLPFCAGVPPGSELFGVPQPASAACLGNWSSRTRAVPSGLVASTAIPGVSFQSLLLLHVDQPASAAASIIEVPVWAPLAFFCASVSGDPRVVSVTVGVGQPANNAAAWRSPPPLAVRPSSCFRSWLSAPPVTVLGVGQPINCGEVEALADVRAVEARSAQITRPEGVVRPFHVSRYKIEPAKSVLARNLFSSNDWRSKLGDEPMPVRPKVPLVSKPTASACRAERLAGATAGPDGPVVSPSGVSQRVAPDADPGEEMALNVAPEVVWLNVTKVPFIHVARGDMPRADQVAQPRGGEGVVLVVIGAPAHVVFPFCRTPPPKGAPSDINRIIRGAPA